MNKAPVARIPFIGLEGWPEVMFRNTRKI